MPKFKPANIRQETGLDIVGDKWLDLTKKGPSIFKYITGFILNWIKLPFQLKYFQNPVVLPPEVKKLDPNNMVIKPDHTSAYYSNNTTMDGYNHDTDNQVVRHAMYLFLEAQNMEEHVYRAASRFFGSNVHGGQNLTNGVSWKDGTAHYHGDNVSTETLALVTLIFASGDTNRNTMELLVNKILDNGGYLTLLNDPGGAKSAEYQKLLKEVDYDRLKVKMENPATNIFPGSSTVDAGVVFLAALSLGGSQKLKRLFKLYYYLFGYGLKARFCSNSLEAITALYVLFKVTKDEKYSNLLYKKFDANPEGELVASVDHFYKQFLYGQLVK